MRTLQTRYRPNCFNNLHLVRKKMELSPELDPEKWFESLGKGALKSIFGLTAAETNATVNLITHMTPKVISLLSDAAARYGMWKGPFSHQAVACAALRIGYEPDGDKIGEWDMKSQESTVVLIVNRILNDWIQAPASMRRTANPEIIAEMQLTCRAFEIVRAKFSSMLPPKHAKEELEVVDESFRNGVYDEKLQKLAEERPLPVDPADIPEMASILDRFEKQTRMIELEKKAELKKLLDSATLESLKNDLGTDFERLTDYYTKLAVVKGSWGERVLAHKRLRRERGLKFVQNLMQQRLRIVADSDYSHIIPAYADMRNSLTKDSPTLNGSASLGLNIHVSLFV